MKQNIIEQGLEIDTLREEMQEMRGQIQTMKREGTGLQERNAHLY